MSMDHIDIVDAALLLDGIADALEVMPGLPEEWERREREDVTKSCRAAAQIAASYGTSGQPYDAAKAYGGTEWRNALLRSLVGANKARDYLVLAGE